METIAKEIFISYYTKFPLEIIWIVNIIYRLLKARNTEGI